MPERVSGIHRILQQTWCYSAILNVSGASEGRREFFRTHADIRPGERVLEIGCGHGRNLEYMPEGVSYTGCDPNARYIQDARERYGPAGDFLCMSAEEVAAAEVGKFDLVLVVSVVHHLDDSQAHALARGAYGALREGGRLLVWEPCWRASQHWLDRFMLSIDRGRFIRTAEGYAELLAPEFGEIESTLLMTPKMLWPQSGCILRSRRPE